MSDNLKRIAELSPEKRALLMLRMKKKQESHRKPGLAPRADRTALPLSFAQERMWFLDQLVPDSPLYNISAAIRLTGELNLRALEDSLNEVVRRHEILRVYFKIEDGNPVQRRVNDKILKLTYTDLSDLDAAERDQQVRNLATKEARKSFNLSRWPLLRVTLLRMTPVEHVLLLTIHHIIADGWSIGVIIREVAAFYNTINRGHSVASEEMPIQYADFAAWQRDWLQGDVLKNQLDYWKSQLAGQQAILELPADHPRPAIQSFHGQRIPFSLNAQVSRALREISRQEGVTLFMTTLAAFKAFLFRYTGQQDIRVGSPIANRNQADTEGLIGFFVNTLVLRSQISGKMTFRELLQQVRDVALGAYAHQDLPFEKLVEEMQIPRDMSHTPLFQVVFDLQNSLLETFEIPGLKLSVIETENETAKFDLMLQLEEGAAQIKGMVEYNTDLFEATTIRRLLHHFESLLASITQNIHQPISELELLSESEKQTLLFEWNQTRTEYPREESLVQIFEEQVARTPEAIAVIFGPAQLTYSELNQRANQLAHFLQKLGVTPASLVTIFMERSLDMIIATLGILKSGSVYVPLDTAYPKDRMAFMLKDTQAPVLLTQQALLENLPENYAHVVCVDTDWPKIALERRENPAGTANGDSLAYIIYTSGSTGIPKGVAVPHKAISRLVINTNYVDFQPNDRVGQASNVSFDAATWEIWGALLNGSALIGIPKDIVLNPLQLVDFIREQKISMLFLTTSLFNQVALEIPDAFKTLRTVMFGGEAADPKAVRKVLENGAPKHVLNGYGPTENTTFSAVYEAFHVPEGAASLSIGKPIANSTAYILDENLKPVPVGVVGELYVGGDGVAQEYYHRPRLTAEKFIPDPFSQYPGSRMYRTGDLARYFSDGNIDFLGRIDLQVKIRGFRIELGEIESVLQQHPALQDGLVLAREDKPGQKRLVGYIIPRDGLVPETAELRTFLLKKLPEYMVPTAFVTLESFPLTPNGKVDRQSLPAPEQNREDFERNYVPPRTKLETALIEMWQEILSIEKIGIYDNFFELGGNSLQAAVFINRIQKKFKQEAHVRSIFLAPTIAEFATYVNEYFPEIITRFFGEESSDTGRIQPKGVAAEASPKITPAQVQKFDQLIQPLPSRPADGQPKNPPAIFVLSPPRSGSTLFRVMLAGNPKLFAPPELDLLSFNTLAERRSAFSNEYQIWQEAAWRSIMEIKDCPVEEAREIMEDCEARNLATKDFYRLLQDWIPDKILVDKTPSYPMDLEILKRAELDFENPKFIHLTRHPYASIYSFLEAKLDKNFFRYEHPFSRRELAELIWIVCHRNILEFLKQIPAERQLRVDFETLVSDPEPGLRAICGFLEIDFHPDMLKPYQGERMTDGVKPSSQMVGDFKFYLHKKIDSQTADRWKKFHHENFLSEISWQLARELGYFPTPDLLDGQDFIPSRTVLSSLKPVVRTGKLPLSFQQQRLWFLDQLDPESTVYNIPVALRIQGKIDLSSVEKSLNAIIRRHEILRTNFANDEGQPVLKFREALKIDLKVIDLTATDPAEKETQAGEIVAREAQKPFHLATDPLIRALIVRLEADEAVILLTMHHIISDGWSAGIITREFAFYYQASAHAELPALPVQYADFAAWQRGWLKADVLERQLSYWRENLAGIPTALELPTDRPRPAEMTYHGRSERFVFSEEFSTAIKQFGRKNGLTEFMTLLATFQILLSRYSGQDDICVGTPVANRGRSELEELIGFFVNTLVIRTPLEGAKTFREVTRRVKNAALGAFANQDLPFEMLVDEIQPERNMSRSPIFQVMFAYQNTPGQQLSLPGMEISPYQYKNVTSMFDLTLSVREYQNELRGVIEYNTDLFNQSTIQRMLSHFRHLLEQVLQNIDHPVSDLELMTVNEKHQILTTWNDTRREFPPVECVQHLFEKQAEKTPAAVALMAGGESWSYAALNARANQLAHYLILQGVTRESRVGICLERSPEMICGLIAILKSGGAYVPLDPEYPEERLQFMIQDSEIQFLLTHSRFADKFSNAGIKLIAVDTDQPAISVMASEKPDVPVSPENLAYLIYTSGSTGTPKGVSVAHQSVVNHNLTVIEEFGLTPADRVLQFATINFDAAVEEIFPTLGVGAALVLRNNEKLLTIQELLNLIQENQISVVNLSTPYWHAWVSEMERTRISVPGTVRLVILGGDKASSEKMRVWNELGGDRVLVLNTYGPTETTIISTLYRPDVADKAQMGKIEFPIGRPIANTQVFILDQNFQPTPVGVSGELFIAGTGLARGYHNRPDITAEKFLPNPFSKIPGQQMYRTGDRVRYRPDGQIEFLGRVDNQLKIRGFRVEIGEIEARLEQHPAIKEAAVLALKDISENYRLVGYYVVKDSENPNPESLREYLSQKLPDYMIPAQFLQLPEMPLKPNGKLDRRALPAPQKVDSEATADFVQPGSVVEKQLADVWQQVLNRPEIGIHDNFFELGGDSILTIQVVARAKQAGLEITPRQLFQNPTIAALATVVGTAKPVLAEQGAVSGEFPLTPIQHVFFEKNFANPNHWNQSILLDVHQPLEFEYLSTAVAKLLAHHDALRLRFEKTADGWKQLNAADPAEIPVEFFDFTDLGDTQIPIEIENTANALQAGLNIFEGRLLKVACFNLGASRSNKLFVTIHHLAIDGVSWRILLEDLFAAYAQAAKGTAATLPAKTTAFKQWSEKLSEFAVSTELARERDYWQKLKAAPVNPIPVDFPAGAQTESVAQTENISLEPEMTEMLLRDVPSVYGTEMNDVLLTALLLAYRRWTNQAGLLFELEGHGREDLFENIDLSRTVGWFTSIYPVFLQHRNVPHVGELLKSVKEQLRSIPQKGIGFGLLRYLNPATRAEFAALPRPQISFNYLGQFDHTLPDAAPFKIARESRGNERGPENSLEHLISINCSIINHRLQISWIFSSEIHRPDTIRNLATGFIHALKEIIEHCQNPEAGGYTPSDFTGVDLDQEDIDEIMAELDE